MPFMPTEAKDLEDLRMSNFGSQARNTDPVRDLKVLEEGARILLCSKDSLRKATRRPVTVFAGPKCYGKQNLISVKDHSGQIFKVNLVRYGVVVDHTGKYSENHWIESCT